MSKILVIVPTYNEETNIGRLVDNLLTLNLDLDVLVIDDGCDNTENIIKERQAISPNIFFIKRNGKLGRGSAVLEGLRFGLKRNYELFVEMDADFSHHPGELPTLLNLAAPNRVVIGSRYVRGSRIENWSFRRRLFSKVANWFAGAVLGLGINDYTNGYRVYGREAIKKLNFEKIKSSGYIVLSEISYQLFKNGVELREHKTLFVNRSRGASNFSWREIKESFWSVWQIRFHWGLNLEMIVLILLCSTFFIGTWHGLPLKDTISDELYFVGGVLRAMDHHTILPQGVDVPYGTLTYLLNYFLVSIFVLVLLFLFKFDLLKVKIYIFNSPSLLYMAPRIVSAFLAIGCVILVYKIIKKEISDVRTRIFLSILAFTNIITVVILHTGKIWALNTFLLLLSFFYLLKVVSSEAKSGKAVKRNIFLSIIASFSALSNFILTPFVLINIPILLVYFRKQKEIIFKIIKYSLVGVLLALFIGLLNYQGIKDEVYNAFRIHNESLAIEGATYSGSFFRSATKFLMLFPLAILTLLLVVRSKIGNKKLFFFSLIYLIVYFIYISLVTPWSGVQNGLRYLFPAGFFMVFLIASFNIHFTRVFYLIGSVSLLYFLLTLYLFSVPTTYNQAHRWLSDNLNSSSVVIVNNVPQLLLPKNKDSYLLEYPQSCYTRCQFVIKYNLNEDIRPLIIDQFSRAGTIPGTGNIYYVEETQQSAAGLKLVKIFGNNVNDDSYFSVDYNAGNYFDLDFFKIRNFGKSLYLYEKL